MCVETKGYVTFFSKQTMFYSTQYFMEKAKTTGYIFIVYNAVDIHTFYQ